MRRLNVRFLMVMIVATTALATALFVTHYLQQDRISAAQLWQAKNAQQAGQWDKASQHFDRYLEFKPDDAAVMIAYAEMIEQQLETRPAGARNPRKAIYLYEEALKREAQRDDVRRKVVRLYMLPRMRRYKDAESHLDMLARSSPEDGAIWQQRAVCQENTGQYESAAESLRQALQFPPEQVRSHELLARVLRRHLKRAVQADETIAAMMTRFPQSHEAHLARARYRLEFHVGDVAEDAEAAYRLAPHNAEAILLMARVHQQRRVTGEAVALLENGIKLFPSDPRMYRHLAWIEYFRKRLDSARQILQAGIVHCPDSFDLHTALAEILIQGKMFDQVQKIIAELKEKGVREDRLTYLKARIAVEREQWPQAIGMLERLRHESRHNADLAVPLNLLLAHAYRQMGDNDKQLDSLKRVLEYDAQSLPARLGIAAVLSTTNRINEAIREFEQILNLPNAPESAAVDLVRLLIARQQRTTPEKQAWADIGKRIEIIEQRFPNSAEIVLARSDFLAAQGKTRAAAELLGAACGSSKEPRLWMQWAHYAEQADASGLKVLDDARRLIGDHVDLRLKRAAILLQRSPADARRKLAELERPSDSFTDEQKVQLATGLAELCFVMQDFPAARRLFRQLAQDRPHDLHARAMLVEIALREGDRDALPELLSEFRKVEPPGGSLLPMLEARHQLLLAAEHEPAAIERARGMLQTLVQQRPSSPLVHQCLGRLAEAEGQKARAIEHYRQAIQLGDGELRTHHQLIRLLVEGKREKEAEQVVQRVRQEGSLSPQRQKHMLATVAPMFKNTIVQQFVRESAAGAALDPRDRLWVGKMLWDTGDKARAIEEFRAAAAQAPHVAEHWVTLVQALAGNNQAADARAAMDEARRRLAPERVADVVGQCLESLRDFDGAAREYAASLKQSLEIGVLRRYVRLELNMGRTREAIDALQQAIDRPDGAAREDIAWARRHLAVLSTAERKPEQFEKAFALLDANEKALGPNIEDMRARVVLLSHRPAQTGADSPRKQAIELLERIVQHPSAGREDRLALARLLDGDRNWAAAEKQFRAVIASDPLNPAPLAHFVRRLLQQNKLQEASEPLAQLEKVAAGSPITIAYKARHLFLAGNISGVTAELTAHVNGAAQSSERAVRCFTAASLLDEFVRSNVHPRPDLKPHMQELAIEWYQKAIPARPEAIVRMAALWSHAGHMETAFRWLNDDRMKIPLNLRASALIAALRSGHGDEAQTRQVETWLKELAARSNEVVLDMHLADLAELRHDFDAAIALYRKTLKDDPRNLVAMNNLAWVLAHRGPSEEALELVQRVIAGIGPLPDLLDTRAKVYLALGRNNEAIQDLEDALTDAPTALRYFHLALAHEGSQQPDQARDAIQLAFQHGLDIRDLHPVDRPALERWKKNG